MNTVRRIVLVGALALPSAAIADMSGRARVLSGDTFAIGDDVIRLYGVDAPEPRQTCERDGVVRSCGAEATGSLRGIIGGNEVRCDEWDRDRYGRIVSVCHVGAVDLGAMMVRIGMAVAYRKFSEAYGEQEQSAKATADGLWAGRFVLPWAWRRGERLSAGAGN